MPRRFSLELCSCSSSSILFRLTSPMAQKTKTAMPASASAPKSTRSTARATGCSATDAKSAMAQPAPRRAKRPRCYLRGSSYGELRRCLHPNAPLLIGGRGEAQQRVEGVLDGADFEGLRYAVGARKLGKRRCEPEPLVARHVERQDDEPRFRLRAENELDDVRVEPGVPVAARSQRLEPSKARKSASFSRNRSAIAS